jgi:hypothetical protein
VKRPSAYLHIVGLHEHTAFFRPKILQGSNEVLKGVDFRHHSLLLIEKRQYTGSAPKAFVIRYGKVILQAS